MKCVANNYLLYRVGTKMTSKDFWRSDISDIRYRLQYFVKQTLSTQIPRSIEYACAIWSVGRSVQTIDIYTRPYVQASLIRYSLIPCSPTHQNARKVSNPRAWYEVTHVHQINHILACSRFILGP